MQKVIEKEMSHLSMTVAPFPGQDWASKWPPPLVKQPELEHTPGTCTVGNVVPGVA